MTKYDLIKEVLEKLDAFWDDASQTDKNLSAFGRYINASETDDIHLRYIHSNAGKLSSLGYLLAKMCRYARFYNKELLKYTEFSTPEEFGLAASLLHGKTPRKSELLSREVIEIPTGMATIKRLVTKGIVMEINDSDDRRALRIGLTPYGREKVLEAFKILYPLNEIIAGPLQDSEIEQLMELLTKLDNYHFINHENNLNKILSNYEHEQPKT
ncbi:hypothetical protein JCM31826_10900 [Thermaurantimonas aggregans]|uniref:HTH marR-type domain-containing protein n=1 Tax=Thermaurantimonas aggregans TaxID=2173829 RepID=A0A401XKS3_9FLAO|nr:MarR family winged helix-turn-helix transcriptional regulator [Thermaurantimonas aggregans]MCX8147946.1 MarR family winged helix-turn-helix transcriptional regulator [Thermaurantimonas aggregans]GCD77608.1 hypothetical protein JCM31826_10900 [Thermaurantimonas aggregans]